MPENITVALAGNPNSGKTTVFNNLTGARQHVGNWPGVTVEKKEGSARYGNVEMKVVDLPGTYSLTAYSQEEVIARDFVVEDKPDVVVSIVDASNLERNLYLVTQFLELGANVVLALNMTDLVESRGQKIDPRKLSELLGVPVIPMIATKNKGTRELLQAIAEAAKQKPSKDKHGEVRYGDEVEEELNKLERTLASLQSDELTEKYAARWLALKLLENDERIVEETRSAPDGDTILQTVRKNAQHLEEIFGEDSESVIVDRRYGFISGVGTEVIRRTAEVRHTLSDKIDKIVTNRVLGIPIFLVAMWFVFQMTANVSSAYLDWVDGVIGGPITRWTVALLSGIGLGGTWVESLCVDGILAGVGGVMVFVPVLLFLYFFIALLEDVGYMARAAFVMDRLMHALGLHGKSFIPMLIGFGCTVPAVYATRTLESEKDRVLTGLLVPMMSCGARLPVYVIFATAFFTGSSGWVIFSIYLLGIVMAILTGKLFQRTLFRGKPTPPFVMELPPYRLPTLKGLTIHMWERTSAFLRKAGYIIVMVSIVVWFLMNIPWGVEHPKDSLFGKVSTAIAPILTPNGFGTWEAAGALVTGFVAKEVVVSTMSQIYVGGAEEEMGEPSGFFEDMGEILVGFWDATVSTVKMAVSLLPGVDLMEAEEAEEEPALIAALRIVFSPLSAMSFMIFVLLYVPCMVALAAMRHEYGTKWMFFGAGYLTALAYLVSMIVYQGGRLFGIG